MFVPEQTMCQSLLRQVGQGQEAETADAGRVVAGITPQYQMKTLLGGAF